MKLKRVTFYFVDHDNVNNDEIPQLLQDYRFPNRCISPEQITVEETDIGEWSDEHRCNCLYYDLSREFTKEPEEVAG